jgi:hypothetical protein
MPDKIARGPQKRAPRVATSRAAGVRIEAEKADKYIGDQLRALYDAVVVEPVPDRLLRLLDRLDDDAGQ